LRGKRAISSDEVVRPAAVMATRHAFERGDLLPEQADLVTVTAHPERTDFEKAAESA